MRCTHNIDPLWFKVAALQNISSAENRFFSFVELSCVWLFLHTWSSRAKVRGNEARMRKQKEAAARKKKKLERMQSLNSSLTWCLAHENWRKESTKRQVEIANLFTTRSRCCCRRCSYDEFILIAQKCLQFVYLRYSFSLCLLLLFNFQSWLSPSTHQKQREPWHLVKGESETLQSFFSGGHGVNGIVARPWHCCCCCADR